MIRYLAIFIFLVLFIFELSWPSEKLTQWPIEIKNFVIGTLYHTPLTMGKPYFHHGIDLVTKPGEKVYSICDGVGKLFYDPDAVNRRSGVVVTDDKGYTWVYLHLIPSSIPDKLDAFSKDKVYIKKGEYLGKVSGIYYNYPHLHLELWKNQTVLNPMAFLPSLEDSEAPVIHKVIIKKYNSNEEFDFKNQPLNGKIEIIAQIYDKIPPSKYFLTPYEIEFNIEYLSFGESYELSHKTQFDSLPGVKKVRPLKGYKVDPLKLEVYGDIYNVFNFTGKYKTSNYFYYLNKRRYFYRFVSRTNKYIPGWDSTSLDAKGKRKYPNGKYLITIIARDYFGNESKKNITVNLLNQ